MTGYGARQSTYTTGDIITAPHSNLEFDAILTAFGTGGHVHDGTAGNGPKITLTTAVTGTLPVANGGTGAATFTDGGVLIGKGTAAFETTGVLADGTIVIGDGTTNPTTLAAFSSSTGTLNVASGGTGAATLTDGGILLGSGTGAVTPMAVLANGEIIIGDGTTDPVALAAFSSSTGTLT